MDCGDDRSQRFVSWADAAARHSVVIGSKSACKNIGIGIVAITNVRFLGDSSGDWFWSFKRETGKKIPQQSFDQLGLELSRRESH